MTEEKILQKLLIERCRMNVAHICALNHMGKERDIQVESAHNYLQGLIVDLNKDFEFIEDLIVDP